MLSLQGQGGKLSTNKTLLLLGFTSAFGPLLMPKPADSIDFEVVVLDLASTMCCCSYEPVLFTHFAETRTSMKLTSSSHFHFSP